MAIEVHLWNEARLLGWKRPWREDSAPGAEGFLHPLLRSIQAGEPLELIKHIDPYGNTVFN
jgi:hypothetical protein